MNEIHEQRAAEAHTIRVRDYPRALPNRKDRRAAAREQARQLNRVRRQTMIAYTPAESE